jgi:hypothetical protein
MDQQELLRIIAAIPPAKPLILPREVILTDEPDGGMNIFQALKRRMKGKEPWHLRSRGPAEPQALQGVPPDFNAQAPDYSTDMDP